MQTEAIRDLNKFYYENVMSGNVLTNDTASDGKQLFLRFLDNVRIDAKRPGSVTQVTGDYGTFFVKPDGSYTYQLSSQSREYVAAGHNVKESMIYKIIDSAGKTDIAKLEIEVFGPVQEGLHFLNFEGWTAQTYDARATGIDIFRMGTDGTVGTIVEIDSDARASWYGGGAFAVKGGTIDLISVDLSDHDGLSTFGFNDDVGHNWASEFYNDPAPGLIELNWNGGRQFDFGPNFAGVTSVWVDDMTYYYHPDMATL